MNDKNEQELNLDIEINRLVHEPARLKILAYLSLVESADFVFLVSRIGLTMGNLSAHISKLEEAGYIKVIKEFKENRPHTMISLTEAGGEAFLTYRERMLQILKE
ncbi:MAG: transcriptional regulator [Anaerolineales bacterium]|nr:transcriptional regulator [Anaerolineales bacterium]